MPQKQLQRKEQEEKVMRGRRTVKWWIPEGHFNQNIYAFISFIKKGCRENSFVQVAGTCWKLLGYLILIFRENFLCQESSLSHFFWFLRLHFHEDTEGAFDWHLELAGSACIIDSSCLWNQRLHKVSLAVFWITWNRVGWAL